MNERSLRSLSLSAIALARQFGIRVTAEQVEEKISRGDISSRNDLEKTFKEQGIKLQYLKPALRTLIERSYYFPCVAILRDGTSKILISCKMNDENIAEFQAIDPLDPTNQVVIENESEFKKTWNGAVFLVSRETGVDSQDRLFDWTWFIPEIYRFKSLLGITFVVSILTHLLGLAPIVFIQISLDKVLNYGAVGTLYILAAGVVGALVFNGILGFVRDYVINFISTSIEARLAGDVFDKVMSLPASTFQTGSPTEFEGILQSPLTIKNFISRQVLTTIFDATGLLVFMPVLFGYSPALALIVACFTILIGAITLFSRWRQKEESKITGPIEASKRRTVQASVAGIETIKAFSLEPTQRREWRQISSSSIRRSVSGQIASLAVTNINATLTQVMTVVLVFTGVLLVLAGSLSAGAIISCNMLAGKLVSPVTAIFTFFADLTNFKNTIDSVGTTWNGPTERLGAGNQHVVKGGVVCRDVIVKFDDTSALNGLNLEIAPRTKVAVVGPSGSGKTTFLRLCQGFLRPNTGSMEIDGQNIRYLSLDNYRSQTTLIDAKPVFFGATIEENLRKVQPNISEREFQEILDISGLSRVLEELPDGISTEINQFGLPLSQGNRVTVALARGLMARPRILLLDEALVNFDKSTQISFFENFPKISEYKTVMMATHDMRLTAEFEQIIVLEKGVVVGQGNHDDLLETCPLYKDLWTMDQKLSGV
ncbi:MAG: peptidase domain-containing ABC transporter [Pseudomonadota bacterium]|nr:peptidase domain-containing ABC transporter [Pseudomonadota bacterium]